MGEDAANLCEPTGILNPLDIPDRYSLEQNYPNPFNPETRINFQIPANSDVELAVYNLLGQKIKTLFDGHKQAGSYSVIFDGTNLSSGIYLCRLKSAEYFETRKLVLTK
jgi:hypothetical protein